jgi:proline iminopeptidase
MVNSGVEDLYEPVEPYDFGELEVGDGQTLYWETVGTPHGLPAVWLHGGPGSGSTPDARRHFDPSVYRAVLFDQRGCGRSRPLASGPDAKLMVNTTDHLVADIERLRTHLQIDRWVVVGVSWGVTLGLIYAQRHPDRVLAMVLGAVTAGTRRETEWITRDMGRLFPREWERFIELVPPSQRDDELAAAYARLLADPDVQVRDGAARAWCEWEDTHVSLSPDWAPSSRYADPAFRAVFARLVTHYWSHSSFIADGEVLAGMPRLRGIPGILIHGRYDVSSPLDMAWAVHRAWPGSKLVLLDKTGHGGASLWSQLTASLDSLGSLRQ